MRKILTFICLFVAAVTAAQAQQVPLGPRFVLPYQTVIDATGVPLPGAFLFFYQSGTNTKLNTYSDSQLTTPNANPVQANAAGVFPNIILSGNYKIVLTDSSLNQIWSADPVNGSSGSQGDVPWDNITGTPTTLAGYGITSPLDVTEGGSGQSIFTANLPLLGNGSSGFAQGTVTGNTTQFATWNGAKTPGLCVETDASGNLVVAGAGCGASSNTPESQIFATPGSVTTLTLTTTPLPTAAGLVTIAFDGIVQARNTWTINTGTGVITFSAAIPANVQIVEADWFAPSTLAGVGAITVGGLPLTGALTFQGQGVALTSSGNTVTFGPNYQPGGRITPIQGQPVQTTSVTGVTTLYYAPMHGLMPWVPIYNGTDYVPVQFTLSSTDTIGLTLNLDQNTIPGSCYDLYIGYSGGSFGSGSLVFGYGPAWSSCAATTNGACGASASGGRGSGLGTAQLAMVYGLCVNAPSDGTTIRYNNGSISGTFTCPQYQCLHVGSWWAPASQTSLRTAITSTSATTISPSDSCGNLTFCFPYSNSGTYILQFYIKIDSEIMKVTGGNQCTAGTPTGCVAYADTWTVARAQLGTTAATHLINAAITMAPGQAECVTRTPVNIGGSTGGDNAVCGISNVFNLQPFFLYSRDFLLLWTFASPQNTWRACDQSQANLVAWLDPYGDRTIEVGNNELLLGFGDAGVGIDTTSAATGYFVVNTMSTTSAHTPALVADGLGGNLSGSQSVQLSNAIEVTQAMGLHYGACVEYIDSTSVASHSIIGNGQGYQMTTARYQN